MQTVIITTDGSCRPNPGRGGWAAILQYQKHEKVLTGHSPSSTSNRMELQAAIAGLAALTRPCKVEVHSDSTYVIQGFVVVPGTTSHWRIHQWKEHGWKTAARKPIKNQDPWKQLLGLCETHTVTFVKVPAHSGNILNTRADSLAYRVAKEAK